MSDYQESTNDDLDDYDIIDEDTNDETVSNLEESHVLADYQNSVLTTDDVYQRIYHDTYQTTNLITKYEKPRIIGVRAQMIAEGAPLMVDPGDLVHPVEIARKEYAHNKLPIILQRRLPSRDLKHPQYEFRRFSDLQKK